MLFSSKKINNGVLITLKNFSGSSFPEGTLQQLTIFNIEGLKKKYNITSDNIKMIKDINNYRKNNYNKIELFLPFIT